MTTQTHTVSTDALATLGTIIDETAGRDAIHLAVEPVVAAHMLYPGQHIKLGADGRAEAAAAGGATGIVDPFLNAPVAPGQRFWLVVLPRTITSLRHVWEHPAFVAGGAAQPVVADRKGQSEEWLRNFAKTADCPDYETLVAVALGDYSAGVDGDHHQWDADEYLHFNGRDAHGEIPDEFWTHLEIATGKKPPHKPKYFSCSC